MKTRMIGRIGTLLVMLGAMSCVAYGFEYSDYTWHTYNGHQYAITLESSNWVQAEAWAIEVGGHLVTINDNAENEWLADFATANNRWHSYGVAWIGLEYKGEGAMTDSSSWEWQNGESVTFWNPDTIMGLYSGNHMYLHGSDHPGRPYLWNNNPVHDFDPGNYLPGIIEIPSEPPVAVCQDVLIAVGADGYVDASVDGGSYDPDGDSIVYSQNPAGPYPVGVYTVTLTVTDPYGASDSCQAMLVVYDPSGGFVTGGGWIWSAKGAYIADPWLEGKANFGFVSKYNKGASVPTGQTEFVFQAGDLNFHSSSYDWLVVNQNGSNAQFKGSGTINGAGDYKFMLWAGDGVPDTFRIKIWQENGGEVVVYDNGFNQPIGGGSIVVHTK